MTYFSSLGAGGQSALSVALFISLLFLLSAVIYSAVNRKKSFVYIIDILIFGATMTLLAFLLSGANPKKTSHPANMPLVFIIITAGAVIIYSAFRTFFEFKRSRNTITPRSIRQALDNLNTGICFSDENGKIILINHKMIKLISDSTKNEPQTIYDIEYALENSTPVSDIDNIYKFSDNSVWRVKSSEISDSNLRGYSQTYAQNISDLYAVNSKISSENEELRKTNEKTQKMLERLADRIREEETLKLKMQIHNDIGTSLIKISKIMQGDKSEDMEQQLALLENAVSYFSQNKSILSISLDEIMQRAEGMGVSLEIEGEIPESSDNKDLVLTAINECLTNCVIHAKGSKVFVEINENESEFSVNITNDGIAPTAPITEGGGLSSLRKKAKKAGAEMLVLWERGFRLCLVMKKEN